MTTITGETGAGKSIILFALNVVLGSRLDKKALCNKKNIDITAVFNIKSNTLPHNWLTMKELISDQEDECIIRRIVTPQGKNKAYINGIIVTLSQIKELSSYLLNLYTQHAHYSLLENSAQLERLDIYAGHTTLHENLKSSYLKLISLEKDLMIINDKNVSLKTQKELLEYQYEELCELNLDSNDINTLEKEYTLLANAAQQIESLYSCSHNLCESESNINDQIINTIQLLKNSPAITTTITNSINILNEAEVNIKEAYNEINKSISEICVDPERLTYINTYLSKCHEVARKHHININQLNEVKDTISKKLTSIETIERELTTIHSQIKAAHKEYKLHASQLSESRIKFGKEFSLKIKKQLKKLSIPNAEFLVKITSTEKASDNGSDRCEYLISFNKGQFPQPLNKIISGGELSRVGLAIQVISSQKTAPPTIIFDEVDVGISGATAEEVGRLLQELSKKIQVICITHQAQVAAQGNQHLHVFKHFQNKQTIFQHMELSKSQRIKEISRIIGGVNITPQTIAHAKAMLMNSPSQKL